MVARKSDQDQEGEQKNTQHFVHQKDDKDINVGRPGNGEDPADEFEDDEFNQVDGGDGRHAIEV